ADALTQVARAAATADARNSEAQAVLRLGKPRLPLVIARVAHVPGGQAVARRGGLDVVEAQATTLEHLGHAREALALWRRLYVVQPRRLQPALAVARLALAEGDLSLASAAYWRAYALAPKALATRLLGIDYLEATGHERMALTAIRDLRRSDPQWRDGALREAQANELLGQRRPAWHLGRKALELNPNDNGLRTWYDGLREEGAATVAFKAQYEQSASLSPVAAQLLANAPLSDSVRLAAVVRHVDWPGAFCDVGTASDLSPGYGFEAFFGLRAPLLDGRVSVDWGLDRLISLELGWSERSLFSDLSAPDERLALEGSWVW
ncbi:MAG TPA: hypothetical protein V6D47_10470, partial [Oscillatoriaceae cyanobacterium]